MRIDHTVHPGVQLTLDDFDTKIDGGYEQAEAVQLQAQLALRLSELQELMFAAGTHSLLIVLQGRDTSGKDGTIRCLLQSLNAQSTRVTSFKVPTPIELAHDFLWRIHAQVPAKGETVIFNRSHYEDILVVRVHDLAPKEVWSQRFEAINQFESHLLNANTILVKIGLMISKKEQEERLLDREKDPLKSWKLSVGDWKERANWDDFSAAYEDVFAKCSTKLAPWSVIPADRKWYRNLAVTEILIDALAPFEDVWRDKLEALGSKMKLELEEFRATEVSQNS